VLASLSQWPAALADFAAHHGLWMTWNTVLALVPLLFAAILFRAHPPSWPRNPLWWAGLAAFVLFLPNAPYVMTDVVHLLDTAGAGSYTPGFTVFVVGAIYATLFAIGTLSYALSVKAMAAFVAARSSRGVAPAATLAAHAACAVGIYMGRFLRLNSWEVVTAPGRVLAETTRGVFDPWALAGCGVLFVGLAVLYAVSSRVVDVARRHLRRYLETSS